MLHGELDISFWLLFPTGSALVAFAVFWAPKAWSHWFDHHERTSTTSSLPAQVRNVRKIGIELTS